MSDAPMACGACEPKGLCGGKGVATFKDGAWTNNPVNVQMLGICSVLAVTVKTENSLVMGAALIFVCVFSNLFISLLRKAIPRKIRMIAEVAIIATFVILFDEILKAFYWDMSRQLGPYVGLIVTNCIVMGRAEAFATQNPPLVSMVDGLANGLGYAAVVGAIGAIRELLGKGEIFGLPVLPDWYPQNLLMILAPGAFIMLGFLIALFNAINARKNAKGAKPAGGN